MLSQDSLYKHLAEEELPLVIMLEIKEMLILTENSEDTWEGYWDINGKGGTAGENGWDGIQVIISI